LAFMSITVWLWPQGRTKMGCVVIFLAIAPQGINQHSKRAWEHLWRGTDSKQREVKTRRSAYFLLLSFPLQSSIKK
ncbi:MAG: hypothetical protein AAFO69_11950, partial [Bacteroidota bacterium]